MARAFAIAALASMATAFPAMMKDSPELKEQMGSIIKRQLNGQDPLKLSQSQSNCGFEGPCLAFDPKDQLVSVSGENAFVAPSPSDIRGPCPGLNAAANHGYLPRTGIASIEETVTGLGAAYNLGPRISAVLAAYAVAVDGNIVEGTWSIGGPLPSTFNPVVGNGYGLSYSHNNYEGDASIARYDAYTNQGDAHSLSVEKFTDVYNVGGAEDRYTLDKFRQRFHGVQQDAINTNPYYFTGLFSTVVVVPAAYNFVINLMSNHTAAEPSGYLDGYNFKSFFGITGEPGAFQWQRGQERIPENWYRRPTAQPYEAQDVVGDVLVTYLAYPNTLLIGGNTGTVNSFTGLTPGNLSSGTYNAATLADGDNFACFAFQLAQNGLPSFVKPALGALSQATNLLNGALAPVLGDLSCPQWDSLDQGLFNDFPGHTYSPTGADTNY